MFIIVSVCVFKSQRKVNNRPFPHPQKDTPQFFGLHKTKSKHELKLLEKIPEDAEATVVLVGQFTVRI